MRIVAVIDIRQGRAVHARGGRRSAYEPVEIAAGVRVDGDMLALARVYVDVLGVRELYVADLDAIEHRAAMNVQAIARLAALGKPLWVDAGVSRPTEARAVIDAGAGTAIVGLETLTSFDGLGEICAAVGGERVAFSVDLREGLPIALPNVVEPSWRAPDVATRAADAGAASIIVLDLARVGTGSGVDVELLAAVRQAIPPRVALLAGGGVRDASDVERLGLVGCDGVLVATALLGGMIEV